MRPNFFEVAGEDLMGKPSLLLAEFTVKWSWTTNISCQWKSQARAKYEKKTTWWWCLLGQNWENDKFVGTYCRPHYCDSIQWITNSQNCEKVGQFGENYGAKLDVFTSSEEWINKDHY